jgi:hypothetical protein
MSAWSPVSCTIYAFTPTAGLVARRAPMVPSTDGLGRPAHLVAPRTAWRSRLHETDRHHQMMHQHQ